MHSLKALGVPIRASRTAAAAWLILCLALTGTATEAPAQTHALAVDRIGYSPEELTAIARLLAGTDPQSDSRALQAVVRTDAWRAHRKASRWGDRQLQERLQHMDEWQRAALPPGHPGGVLLYPFSGPDFVNAFALFPDYKTYVFFSLELPGEVPLLDRMDERQLAQLFSDLRGALNDLVALNFFITPNMKENLQTDSLQGTVPLLLAQMGLLGLSVHSVEAYDPWPASALSAAEGKPGEAGALKPGKPAAEAELPLRAIKIEFDDRDQTRRTLLYLSLDVSDGQLRYYPEFIPWLRSFEQPTVLLKSASYLLHGGNFRKVRGVVRERARLIVQDDTGMPYRILRDDGFQISLFGQYERPVKLFENRYQKDLDDAFASAGNTTPVPFPFGYNWRKEGRSGVIVARRPGSDT
jgi:hypothetical protein